MQGPQHITYLLFLFLWSYRVHIIKTQTVRRWFLLLGPCLGSLCRDEKWATRTPEGRFAQPPVSALQKNARRKGAKLSFSKGDGLLAAFRAQTNHNSSVIKTSPRGSAGDGWHFQTRYLAKLPLSHSVQRSQLQHLPDTFAGGGFTQIFFFFFKSRRGESKGCVYMRRVKPRLGIKAPSLVPAHFWCVNHSPCSKTSFLLGGQDN